MFFLIHVKLNSYWCAWLWRQVRVSQLTEGIGSPAVHFPCIWTMFETKPTGSMCNVQNVLANRQRCLWQQLKWQRKLHSLAVINICIHESHIKLMKKSPFCVPDRAKVKSHPPATMVTLTLKLGIKVKVVLSSRSSIPSWPLLLEPQAYKQPSSGKSSYRI